MTSDGGPEFDAFYRATYNRLVASVFALTGDLAAAQDVAQEAFVRAWSGWGRVSGYDSPTAWLFQVAHRLAVSRWRRASVAARALARQGAPGPAPGPGPDTVALVAALRTLPERHRLAVVLHHMGGLTVTEVAAELGTGEGTVKTWLARGRRALAEQLSDSAPTEPTEGALS